LDRKEAGKCCLGARGGGGRKNRILRRSGNDALVALSRGGGRGGKRGFGRRAGKKRRDESFFFRLEKAYETRKRILQSSYGRGGGEASDNRGRRIHYHPWKLTGVKKTA